jgi:hypothetical protein
MHDIIGKWVQAEGQPYAGLWFEFKPDGSFVAQYEAMGIVSGGTYTTDENTITMQQTEHTLGLTGKFEGLYAIEDDQLMMALAAGPGQAPPDDLSEARIYNKAEE